MENVVLVIHLLLAVSIIGFVLLQRSEGGGLGIGGGNGGLGGFASPQGTASALTKVTAFCAAGFFCTSIILGILAGAHSSSSSIVDELNAAQAAAEASVDEPEVPVGDVDAPASETPSVPIK